MKIKQLFSHSSYFVCRTSNHSLLSERCVFPFCQIAIAGVWFDEKHKVCRTKVWRWKWHRAICINIPQCLERAYLNKVNGKSGITHDAIDEVGESILWHLFCFPLRRNEWGTKTWKHHPTLIHTNRWGHMMSSRKQVSHESQRMPFKSPKFCKCLL